MATSGEKELRRDWHETKIEGTQLNLLPTDGSLVDERDKVGMMD